MIEIMVHLIDKDALVAEIERRISEIDKYYCNINSTYQRIEECRGFLSFLNTLEVREVDLEKETKKWWKEHLHLDPKNQLWMDAYQSIVFAEHFYELGMQVSNKAQKDK